MSTPTEPGWYWVRPVSRVDGRPTSGWRPTEVVALMVEGFRHTPAGSVAMWPVADPDYPFEWGPRIEPPPEPAP